MGNILVIAEKPSVGRDIAAALGANERREGYLEGSGYIVSWAIGHLVSLCAPEDIDEKYKRWSVDTLPILPEDIPIKPLPRTRAQLTLLKKLMNSPAVDSIVCATDSGREGELIFRWIYQAAKCKKPVMRLWISSLVRAAILEGFRALKPAVEYDPLFRSALCRAQADWLVGMNGTRAYTVRYGALLSIGRVQTPTLRMLCERKAEILAFVPREFYRVRADFGAYQGFWIEPDSGKTRTFDRELAERVCARAAGAPARVESVEVEEKRQPPPLLHDLTDLQREANRRFGFPAKKTLALAQALYEKHKLITYPRTDSRYLSRHLIPKLPDALRALEGFEGLGAFVAPLLALDRLPITGRIVDDKKVRDHHAIIPTGKRPGKLAPDEARVFELIARRFIAAFYPAHEWERTRVVTAAGGDRFETVGKRVLKAGWREVCPFAPSADSDDDSMALPELKEGDSFTVIDAQLLSDVTRPPPHYTDATLLSAMENAGRSIEDEALREQMKDSGLGTPATRAAIIERLIEVGYAAREKRALVASEKGMRLIGLLPVEMTSPETTGKWERALSRIARGEGDDAAFIASIRRYAQFIVQSAQTADASVQFEREAPRKKRAAAAPGAKARAPRRAPAASGTKTTSVRAASGAKKTPPARAKTANPRGASSRSAPPR